MKVLFITSGFIGVYKFFELSIIQSMNKIGMNCEVFTNQKNPEALKHRIQSFQPTFIFVLGGFNLSKPLLELIKQSKIKSAIWMTEDPYYMDLSLPLSTYFQTIFTIDQGALTEYRNYGATDVYHLPLGTDPQLYYPQPVSGSDKFDICFVGVPYVNRIDLIKFLLKITNYRFLLVGNGWAKHLTEWKKKKNVSIVNVRVTPVTVVEYYNQSKIVLNIHRPDGEKNNKNSKQIAAKSINNRTFDVASCEAFQLIDHRVDLPIHFEIGNEIVPYQNKEDLLQKINFYLTHEQERKRIAHNARKRVLSEHTFDQRVLEIFNKVQK